MKTMLLNVVVLLASASLAHAGPILTSFLDPGTGNIFRSGNSLVGTNFGVSSILSGNTPLNSNGIVGLFNSVGALSLLKGDAHLNFATGTLLSDRSFGPIEVIRFAPGGSFSLVGGANLEGLLRLHAGDIPAGSTLLSGQFTRKVTVIYDTQTGQGTIFGRTSDTLNPALASYYGLSGAFKGFFDVTFQVDNHGDIHTLGGVMTINPVPEPGVLALLASGGFFGGVCGFWRRGRGRNRKTVRCRVSLE
jgi:PEP-CTERM motif